MTQEAPRLAKLGQSQSKLAIDLAMRGQWREAVKVNQEIIDSFPGDVDAYNRLGRACMELGEYARAREAYGRTIDLDPYNTIARKNLQRLAHLKETSGAGDGERHRVEPQHFIEEIGKAGVVNLYELAPQEVLAKMVAGDAVDLKVEGTNLVAMNLSGEYLGMVELRHAQRLTRLLEGGNRYSAAVVSSADNSLSIIIREVYQHPDMAGRLSFPPKGPEEVRFYTGEKPKAPAEFDEEAAEGLGYTIIGGEEEGVELAEHDIEDEGSEN
ncbi:MAG: tetratricopeptide repeat protein [Chloroflexi bacterium]|nr:tetratricopeptide repeat protein [Chloroflexota bacterium]